jgi:hypothetical protein
MDASSVKAIWRGPPPIFLKWFANHDPIQGCLNTEQENKYMIVPAGFMERIYRGRFNPALYPVQLHAIKADRVDHKIQVYRYLVAIYPQRV